MACEHGRADLADGQSVCTTKIGGIMEPFEGVCLNIVDGVALFQSGLTGAVLSAKSLSDFQTVQDVGMYSMEMGKRQWWPHVKAKFENAALSRLNKL